MALVFLAGCRPGGDLSRDLTPDKVKLVRADAKALDELVAAQKGKVVLVDYWATWCLPCVENFPHTVELATKYRGRGLATIAVNFDLLEDEPKVREFLAKTGADFENLISQHDSIGQKTWGDFGIGPLPEYRLYDRQGKLSQKWEGVAPGDELTKKIEELLAQ
jgi:thiol-disulfide isomerase/thioredoxin